MRRTPRFSLALLMLVSCRAPNVRPSTSCIAAAPATLAFANTAVGTASTQTTVVSNCGGASLSVTGTAIEGGSAAFFTVPAAVFTLKPGEEHALAVTYQPTAQGAHAALLRVQNDAQNGANLTVALTGQATIDLCAKVTCNAAPAPLCTDANTLSTHDAAGSCNAGTCSYVEHVTTCPFGCAAGACATDPCASITCDTPPPCFKGVGICAGGVCGSYQADVGAACEDGNACNVSKTCDANGKCFGTRTSGCVVTCTWPYVVSGDGQSCVCDVGAHACGSTCVSDSSVFSCGNRCVACPGVDDGSAVCSNGQCTRMCSTTRKLLTGLVSISASQVSTCAVTSTGTVKCWGEEGGGDGSENAFLLGVRKSMRQSMPVDVPGITSAVSVSVGTNHACAVVADGSVWCWGGRNYFGELGNGVVNTESKVPVLVAGLGANALSVSAGSSHTCVVTKTHTVKCWGDNTNGQLGDGLGDSNTGIDRSATPVDALNLSNVATVSAGNGYTCAVTQPGAAYCWGTRKVGGYSNTPVAVTGLSSGVIALSSGEDHACFLSSTGAVNCWGLSSGSNLKTVTGLTGALVSITAGRGPDEGCALTATGSVQCWDDRNSQRKAKDVGISGASAISSSSSHTCAIVANGGAKCWGGNSSNAIGDGLPSVKPLPVPFALATNASQMSIRRDGGCIINKAGGVQCWGKTNNAGQLGDGTTQNRAGLVNVVGLSSGVGHLASGAGYGGGTTCAATATEVRCWGDGSLGALGDNSENSSGTPVVVSNIGAGVKSLCGNDHSFCAVDATGAVWCWGDNTRSQHGDGTVSYLGNPHGAPVTPTGLGSGQTQVVCGGDYNCALDASGAVRCWGYGKEKTPTDTGVTGATQIGGCYGSGFCAVYKDGTVSCYDGLVWPATQSHPIAGTAPGIVALAGGGGGGHACLLTNAGEVQCWKFNDVGELGDGSTISRSEAADVYGFHSGAAFVAVGSSATCIVNQKGAIFCNGSGENTLVNELFGGCTASAQSDPVDVVTP